MKDIGKASKQAWIPPGLLAQVVPGLLIDLQLRSSNTCTSINNYPPPPKKEKKKISSKQAWMKTSNWTATHHSSISSYALTLTLFSKSVGIRTLHVQKRLEQNYQELISLWFLFCSHKIEKKKKSSLLLSFKLF